jgi:hypothetical protein
MLDVEFPISINQPDRARRDLVVVNIVGHLDSQDSDNVQIVNRLEKTKHPFIPRAFEELNDLPARMPIVSQCAYPSFLSR